MSEDGIGQYDDPSLWTRVDLGRGGKDYVSTPTAVPAFWNRGYRVDGQLAYASGEYTIIRHKADGPYTLYRNGVELFGGFCARLKDAKEEACENARGNRKMHVA